MKKIIIICVMTVMSLALFACTYSNYYGNYQISGLVEDIVEVEGNIEIDENGIEFNCHIIPSEKCPKIKSYMYSAYVYYKNEKFNIFSAGMNEITHEDGKMYGGYYGAPADLKKPFGADLESLLNDLYFEIEIDLADDANNTLIKTIKMDINKTK